MRNVLFVVVAALALAGGGCFSTSPERQRALDQLESEFITTANEIATIEADVSSGKVTAESAASKLAVLKERYVQIKRRLDDLKATGGGITWLEALGIAIGTALGLRGVPTGGIGGLVVKGTQLLFAKKEKVPNGT